MPDSTSNIDCKEQGPQISSTKTVSTNHMSRNERILQIIKFTEKPGNSTVLISPIILLIAVTTLT